MVMLVDDDDIYGDVSGWVFKMCVFFSIISLVDDEFFGLILKKHHFIAMN